MTTVNYDRAVSYYDETRGSRPGVSQRDREALLAWKQSQVSPATERSL